MEMLVGFSYSLCPDQGLLRERPAAVYYCFAGAEGATRPESLRQKDHNKPSALESGLSEEQDRHTEGGKSLR